jgi:ParB family chromosome partitioning protein
MAKPRSGLGRDFYSLLDDNVLASDKANAASSIRISDIEPRSDQPRKTFEREPLENLADSIAQFGVLQPIVVRESTLLQGTYEILAGERRWRAAKMAGLSEIPAVILEGDDLRAAQIAVIENVQREDLNPIEEAAAYRSLMNDHNMTQEELSQRVGKSRSAIANAIRLLDLPESVCDMVIDGKLSAGHARALLGLTNPDDIPHAAEAIVSRELSVRATEALVKTLNTQAAIKKQDTPPEVEKIKVNYVAELEKRVEDVIGRKVKITGKGQTKRIEISFSSNEDLEELLKMLCGDEFFEDI